MMSGYSVDLRRRIVSAVESGMSKAQAARTFSVSLSSVKRFVDKAEKGESLAPKKRPGSSPKLDEKTRKLLEEDIRERPLPHPPGSLWVHRGHDGTLGKPLYHVPRHSQDRSHQEKGGRVATEREGFERASWRVMVAAVVEPERLVFVDECGTHTSMAPLYGYAPRGQRLRLMVPRKRGKNTTLLSSRTIEGMGPSMAVEGATTAGVFEAYVRKVLAPSLEEGQIVVMDNLGAHRPKRVRELIETRGCELLYLPSYSPDYNPIEEAFAKIKNLLRKAAARSKEALLDAIAAALSAIGAEDARGFFEHAGYRPTAHLL
jgi:transposase